MTIIMNILKFSPMLILDMSVTEILDTMQGFSRALGGVEFAGVDLGARGGKAVQSIVHNIPSNFFSLSLRCTSLHKLSAPELIHVMASIPPHITHLFVELTSFHEYNTTDLAAIMAAIPNTVVCIDFAGDALGRNRTPEEFLLVMSQLLGTTTARTMNLARNDLDWLGTPAEVACLLASASTTEHNFIFEETHAFPSDNFAFQTELATYLHAPSQEIKASMGFNDGMYSGFFAGQADQRYEIDNLTWLRETHGTHTEAQAVASSSSSSSSSII